MNEINQNQLNECILCFKKADYQSAIKNLKELEKKYTHFLIHWYLAHSYYRIYDYSKSLEHLGISIKLKSEDSINLNFLGEIYLQKNEHKEAIIAFEKVLKIENNNINSLSNLAKIYSELGDFENSKKYYSKIIEFYPQNIGSYYEMIKLDPSYLTDDLIKKLNNSDLDEKNELNKVYLNFINAEYENKNQNTASEIENYIEAKKIFLKKN